MVKRRVFDCFMYDGEIEVLLIRFHELNDVVDTFVIVEATQTHSGSPREVKLKRDNPRISQFVHKIRHVVAPDIQTNDPMVRDQRQRNAIIFGLDDADPNDLIIISDADEIPRASVVTEMVNDSHEIFGVGMILSYFFFNYRNVTGPESDAVWTVAVTKRHLDHTAATFIRLGIRFGSFPNTKYFSRGGWHFSYLMNHVRLKQKIEAFAHQEHNTPEFLNALSIEETVRTRSDLFGRQTYKWDVVDTDDLPQWVLANKDSMSHFFYVR